jgi:pimeloyl-ACP methyl ester carboxylesterase
MGAAIAPTWADQTPDRNRTFLAMRLMEKRIVFLAVVALALVSVSLWNIAGMSEGLKVTQTEVGAIPVTIFREAQSRQSPVVVLAHGFAGSQQLMQPMAVTLARNGYVAVTFDFAGHGRNQQALNGGIANMDRSTRALISEIGEVVAFARDLPDVAPKLALVGHSMASDLVVQFAIDNPSVDAVAALSLFGQEVTTASPKNLIVIDGAWEPKALRDAGVRIVAAADGSPRERVTYGEFAKGTARRFVLAAGAEHIGVLYSRDALIETVAWLDQAFNRRGTGFIDTRGKWLGLLFLGLVILAVPTSKLLPTLAPWPLGADFDWRRLVPVSLAPAVLTPLILWKAPTDFLPLLLGDYLVVHFALYGLLTAVGIWLSPRHPEKSHPNSPIRLALASAGVAAYYIVAMGAPIDAYVDSFMPTASRWPLISAMFCGTAIYFLADEWLTRGATAARGGYAFTKFCFLASLVLAVALNPGKLFFLVIIVPVIFVLFIIYGCVSALVYARTGDPRVGAIGNAFALAWAIALTFPVVD